MAPRANIYIDKGCDFKTTIELFNEAGEEYDEATMSVFNFFGSIRKVYSSQNIADFTIEKANNDITLILSDSQTAVLVPGKYEYDVILQKQTGELSKIAEGLAIIVSTVTEVV
jgi:hypothetical protein